ncbi:MAG: hypothetical protein IPJ84_18720 [Bdellovibrionales bacterium]|nr:hypothetical protein [Bdellovibrionales bacterium]
MLNKLFVFGLVSLSLSTEASPVHFDCENPSGDSLQMSLDDSYFSTSTPAPEAADVAFQLNGSSYQWRKTQYLSFPMTTGETATLFRYDAVNEVYVQMTRVSEEASVNLTHERVDYEFTCKTSY